MPEFKFSCPGCQQHILCDESHRGIQLACPTCGTTITVPPAAIARPPAGLSIASAGPPREVPRAAPPNMSQRARSSSRGGDGQWLLTTMLAFFLGQFGVDRFVNGRIGLGVGKLVTLGACGVWSLVDVVLLLVQRYRDGQGNYEAAVRSLRNALRGAQSLDGSPRARVEGTGSFYLAMTLLRQGRGEEARQLYRGTAASIQSPPDNKQDPIVSQTHHEDLIVWLAYEEAKLMLGGPSQ